MEEAQQRNSLQVGVRGGDPVRDQCMCAVRKRKNNIDYAEAVRQGADGRAAIEC